MLETRIHANYTVNEKFSLYLPGTVPSEWKDECEEDASVKTDGDNLVLKSENKSPAVISKSFDAVSGKLCFESFFFMPKIEDGAKISLLSAGKPVIEFSTLDGSFCVNGKMIRYAKDEIWYRLRFEIDTDKKSALIKVNGKTVLNAVELHNYDVISVGTTKLVFVALCGEHFQWKRG